MGTRTAYVPVRYAPDTRTGKSAAVPDNHGLPVEQGRLARPGVPRHLRSCTLGPGQALGDERHCIFECPRFDGHRLSFARLFDDAHGAMRTLVWNKDQKAVSALILAICTEAWTLKQICPHRPLLAEWT